MKRKRAATQVDEEEDRGGKRQKTQARAMEVECKPRPPQRLKEGQTLGAGNFGQVCTVTDTKTNEVQVWKKLPKSAEDSKADFENEVRVLKHLQQFCGKYTACLIDAFEDDKFFYIRMRLEPGFEGLDAYLRSPGSRTEEDIALLTQNLLDAVEEVHLTGVAHRDIKPANILINPKTGDVRLIDWGLACLGDDCKGYGAIGTEQYMSPELLTEDRKLDYDLTAYQRADRYALGATLLEVALGRNSAALRQNLGALLHPLPKARFIPYYTAPQTSALKTRRRRRAA